MKIALYIVFTIVFVGISVFAWAYIKVSRAEKEKTELEYFVEQNSIDSALQVFIAQFPVNTQIAVAHIQKGNVVFYGYVHKETGVEVVNNQHAVFEIGSVSKTFTAALAAICFEKGLLKPNTTLKEVLQVPMPTDVGAITLEQLSNHTSGLPRLPSNFTMDNPSNPYENYDTTQLFSYLKKAKLDNKPGTVYSYSNTAAGLLGTICANALHLSYEQALQQYIFTLYKMNTSSVKITSQQQAVLVKGQDAEGNETSNWNFDCLAGAGGIKSSIGDMTLYALENLKETNTIFSTCHKPTFKSNEQMSVGLGWHIISTKTGNTILFHNGGTGGYTSSVMLDKQAQKGIVILSNISAFHPKMSLLDALCAQLLKK